MYDRWDCLLQEMANVITKQSNRNTFNQSNRNTFNQKTKKMFLNIPLHEGTQFHVKYQEQFEVFHPISKPVPLHLVVHEAGQFFIEN